MKWKARHLAAIAYIELTKLYKYIEIFRRTCEEHMCGVCMVT